MTCTIKYEPPSPKFSRKRPSQLSYRLQMLQAQDFVMSLRGLPETIACQRAACALDVGPLHMVRLLRSRHGYDYGYGGPRLTALPPPRRCSHIGPTWMRSWPP
jgi:hypothetical protein